MGGFFFLLFFVFRCDEKCDGWLIIANEMQARVSKINENESDVDMEFLRQVIPNETKKNNNNANETQSENAITNIPNTFMTGSELASDSLEPIIASIDLTIMSLVQNSGNNNTNGNNKLNLSSIEQSLNKLNEWFDNNLGSMMISSDEISDGDNSNNTATKISMILLSLSGLLDTLNNVIEKRNSMDEIKSNIVESESCNILWNNDKNNENKSSSNNDNSIEQNNKVMEYCNQCIVNLINYSNTNQNNIITSNMTVRELTQILHKVECTLFCFALLSF